MINIGSGRGVSLNELLQLIAGILGEQPEIEYLPARAVDVSTVVLDISRARTELGWRPKTKLSEGISRVRDWICTFQSMSEIIENAGEVAEEVVPVLRPPAKLRAKGNDNT